VRSPRPLTAALSWRGQFWTASVRNYIAILIVVSVVAAIAVLDRPKGKALYDAGARH
jgi:hypothetical protein